LVSGKSNGSKEILVVKIEAAIMLRKINKNP
jgi:hypothetical protein